MSSTYCTAANIETVYGATNVADWADLDNDADATKISARKTYAIDAASEEIDDVLRTMGYRIPIRTPGGSTLKSIEHLCAVMAGLWLYESRGAIDHDRAGAPKHGHAWRRTWARRRLEAIRDGTIRLDAALGN